MSTRLVRTKVEFEGEISEELALVEGSDLRPWAEGSELEQVGRSARRVDGPLRVSGRARYTADVQLPGMLHARILRSPHPHARVVAIDARRAEAIAGVRAVLHRFNAPPTAFRGEEVVFREVVRFVGDEVAAVAADDDETAAEALRALDVSYEPLPFVVDLEDAMRAGAPKLDSKGNVLRHGDYARGDIRRGFREADAVVEATYRTSTQLHNCLETHGSVAHWDGERLTVWDSTQHIFGVRSGLQAAFKLPLTDIRVISEYMGGGFGSKNGIGKYTVIAAILSRQLGRPVRCVLTREEENVAAGNRSATLQRIRIGGKKDGRITAVEHRAWSGTGTVTGWVASCTGPTDSLYAIPNVRSEQHIVLTNTGNFSAFRAPGYVEGTFALESAIDELSDALGVDPLAVRRKNLAKVDPQSDKPYSLKRLDDCYTRGAQLIGWRRRRAGGIATASSHLRRGLGVASQVWGGGGGPPAYATVHLNQDGTAIVRAGTQDIGTGTRTVLAQIVGEELHMEPSKVRVLIGDTDAPYAPLSAGSMTLASVGPATRIAAVEARKQLLAAAAGLMEVRVTELRLVDGHVVAGRAGMGKRLPVREIFEKLENYTVIGNGSRHPNPESWRIRTFGAHFAEVEVDTDTGLVRVIKIVAVHDIGRVVNPLTAASQVEGGVLQALGFALYEERILDRRSGYVMNPNLEEYHIATGRDTPEIVVEFVNRADTRSNNLGSKGLGEPPIIPTAAAVANAVANAIGARVRHAPVVPGRVLEALGR